MANRSKFPDDTSTERWCSSCNQFVDKDKFHKAGKGLQRICAPCRSAATKKPPKNPEDRDGQRYCTRCQLFKCIDEFKRIERRGRVDIGRECKDCRSYRSWVDWIARTYDMTPEEYQRKFDEQNGLCGLCGKPEINGKRLAVDHCHKSGRLGKLLCQKCNVGLGSFDDDVELLVLAIRYIEVHRMRD